MTKSNDELKACREAFEIYFKRQFPSIGLGTINSDDNFAGEYINSKCRHCWQFWKESRNTRANVAPTDGDAERLREALEMLYDAWENGAPCFENDGGEQGSFIGNAFELTYEEEIKILSLIPRERKKKAALQSTRKPDDDAFNYKFWMKKWEDEVNTHAEVMRDNARLRGELAAKSKPDDVTVSREVLNKLMGMVDYLVGWQSKDGAGVVTEVADDMRVLLASLDAVLSEGE